MNNINFSHSFPEKDRGENFLNIETFILPLHRQNKNLSKCLKTLLRFMTSLIFVLIISSLRGNITLKLMHIAERSIIYP